MLKMHKFLTICAFSTLKINFANAKCIFIPSTLMHVPCCGYQSSEIKEGPRFGRIMSRERLGRPLKKIPAFPAGVYSCRRTQPHTNSCQRPTS